MKLQLVLSKSLSSGEGSSVHFVPDLNKSFNFTTDKQSKVQRLKKLNMDEEKLNKPMSRKSSSAENGKGKDIIDNGDGGEVTLKAKMSLVNGITVIVGSIIGRMIVL